MAAGAGANVTVTGLSTLRTDSLPSGFNTGIDVTTILGATTTTSTTAWGAASGFYPFLNFQYPHGAVEVSGTVFSGYDTSLAATGLTVALSSFGTIQSTALTTTGGAYALLADGGQQSEVLLSGNGSDHANTYLGTPTASTTANLYFGYLRLPSASSSLSSTLTGVALAAGNNSGADYLYTSANGLAANTGVDILTGGAFAIDTALNAGTGTVAINAGGAVTQTATLTAAKLDLLGAGASYSLTNTSNSIETLAANTGAVSLTDGSSLTVGAVNATTGVSSTGAVTLSSSNPSTNLTLSGAVSAGVGSNVVLSATGNFVNNAGASAVSVSGSGSWLIYSNASTGDTFGALNSNNTAVWGTPVGGAVSATGDRYVFALQPTLTFTSTNDSKTYGSDATTQIQSDFAVSGLQSGVANAFLGDTASAVFSGAPVLSSSGTAASAQVSGGPYSITVAQGSVTTLDGYVFGSASTGHLTINPLALTASLVVNVTKTYDGTTAATLTGANYSLSAPIGADVVSLVPVTSGSYDTKDVGTGKTVSVSGLVLTGAQANDYTVASDLSGAVGIINPLALTASLVGSVSKTYDGTTAATLTGANYTLSAPIGADVVSLVPVTAGSYDTKDAGTGKTVSVSGLTLTGADADDYSVAASLSGAVGVINPLALTAGLTGTVSKTYDGTTAATLTGANFTLSAAIFGAVVSVAPATPGTYDTKDVGTGKSVSVSGLTLTGADADDYSLSTTSLSGNIGTITPLALTASLTGIVSKVYDGTTAATLTASNYLLGNAIAGDSVSVVPVTSGTYDTKDAGTGKSVSVSGLILTGADAEDYSVTGSLAGNIGTIIAKPLTAAVVANNKTYDATTTDTGAAQLTAGVISGDQVSLSSGSYTFSDPNAGQNKTVSVTGISLVGADSQNYSLSVPADATATITPRPITIAADNASKLVGQADPPLMFSITSGSLVGGTQVSGALTRAPGDSLGSYDITQGSLSLSSNYALSFVDGVFTISPAMPSLVAFAPANGAASNAFNGPSAFTFSGTGLGVSQTVAPSTDTAGASSSLLPTSQSDDNSDTPYPDNRRISDKIRFSAAAKP